MPDTSALETDQSKAKVFISYSRKDIAFADKLDAALRARGFEPLIDRTDILAFEEWWKRVEALIGRADTVVFVLSPDAVRPESIARKEVAFAASLNKRFAPIMFRLVEDRLVPEELAKLNFIFFDDAARFEQSADRLSEALNTDIGWIRQHTDFGEQARRWTQAKGASGLLLRSPVLEQAERWIASRPAGAPAPTDETQAFIRQSRHAATRRRNVLTGSLAAGFVVALVLAGLAYWQRGVAVEQRNRAEQTLATATRTANGLVFDLAGRFTDSTGVPISLIKEILDRAIELQQQLITSGQITPELEYSEANALSRARDALQSLGDEDGALKIAERLPEIMERLVRTNPNNAQWQRDLAFAYINVGRVLEMTDGNRERALVEYQKAIPILQKLMESEPDNPQWKLDLSRCYQRVGDALYLASRDEESLPWYEKELALVEQLFKQYPDNTSVQSEFAIAYNRIGVALEAAGKYEQALMSFQKGVELGQRLVDSHPDNSLWQRMLELLYLWQGNALLDLDRHGEALSAYRQDLEIANKLGETDRQNAVWQADICTAHEQIGRLLAIDGKRDEALAEYQTSLPIRQKLANTNSADAQAQYNLASLEIQRGRLLRTDENRREEALAAFIDASSILEKLTNAKLAHNSEWQLDLAISYEAVGDLLADANKWEDALEAYKKSLTVGERLVASNGSILQWQRGLSLIHDKVGNVEAKHGRLDEALNSYRRSLTIRQGLIEKEANNSQWQQDLHVSISNLGGIAYQFVLASKFATALEVIDQAISLASDEIWLYTNRAHALMFLDRVEEARALYLKYRGQKVDGDKSWETVVLEDFAELQKAGFIHPLMQEIEKAFAGS